MENVFGYVFDIEDKVFVIWSQKLGPDVREGKRRQFNYIGMQVLDSWLLRLKSLILNSVIF